MDKKIYDIITRVYTNKDYGFFIEKCKATPDWYADIPRMAAQLCKRTEFYSNKSKPLAEFFFQFREFSKGEFSVKYRTILQISKVAEAFIILHEFEVKNADPDALEPDLDSCSQNPYITEQMELENLISSLLVSEGYTPFTQIQMDEVVFDVKMPEGSMYGSQMTVETALFKDILGICEKS